MGSNLISLGERTIFMKKRQFSLLFLLFVAIIFLIHPTRYLPGPSLHSRNNPASPLLDAPVTWWKTATETIHDTEYQVTWQDKTYLPDLPSAYQAPNRAHDLRTYFLPQGIRVLPRTWSGNDASAVPWEIGLSLINLGYPEELQPLPFAKLVPADRRMEYQRGNISEWYVNDKRGLEHKIVIAAPPASNFRTPTNLILEMAMAGTLTSHLAKDGAIEFLTSGGDLALRLGELTVTDATGRTLPAFFAFAPLQSILSIHINITSAVYPINIVSLTTTPNWTAESDLPYAKFGRSVATAGDVNGDGYDDVIIGASEYDNGQPGEGRAFVFHGSAVGLSVTPNWTAESNQAFAYFGTSVSTAGDINADGYADVIVGAYTFDNSSPTNEGQAFAYYGSAAGLSTTPNWTGESDQTGFFGLSVDTAGDVNGDGYDDVIIGAPYFDNGQVNEGRAFLYYGSAAGLSATANWSVETNNVQAYFGSSVGTAGDVNGDGFADVIVSAYQYSNGQYNEGRAFVYHGSATGLSLIPNWTAEGDQFNAIFGSSAGTAGDVNGDGYADVIVGASNFDNGQGASGRAFVYHGSAAGLSTNANWTAQSDEVFASFASSSGTAGDVNGDGYDDVIIGSPNYSHNQAGEGRAYVYEGSANGLLALASWTTESDKIGALFGFSVGTAGDVNNDNYADIIVGAMHYDNGQPYEGRVFVYHGEADPPSVTSTPTSRVTVTATPTNPPGTIRVTPILTATSRSSPTPTRTPSQPTKTPDPRTPTRTPTQTPASLVQNQTNDTVLSSAETINYPFARFVAVTFLALSNLFWFRKRSH
ncbi:MAG: FG-GAP repeat protein [Anaerolineales bacterium]|nr:FG-GAP repeat protein [Anaerolineales bacterium]